MSNQPMIRVPSWSDFQQYKDRNPPWIKLHKRLLLNREWDKLSGDAAKLLVELWLVASESSDGTITIPTEDLAWRVRRDREDLAAMLIELERADFLDLSVHDAATVIEATPPTKWADRHIPAKIRHDVMERDGWTCVACGALEPLEIDHIVPISQGGSSVPENLQVLCRPCNRIKRSRTVRYASVRKASPEVETETETERDLSGATHPPSVAPQKSEPKKDDPAEWMHSLWQEVLGSGRALTLTPARRQKYRAMYAEQLKATDDPVTAWRAVLWAVTQSPHHMSTRDYQLPESFLSSPERREKWVERAIHQATNTEEAKRNRTVLELADYLKRNQA